VREECRLAGVDVEAVVSAGLKHVEHGERISLRCAVDRYAKVKMKRSVSTDTLLHDRSTLEPFVRYCGEDTWLGEIGREGVQGFIDGLRGKLSAVTLTNYRKTLSAFFNWALGERMIAVNPIIGLIVPEVVRAEVKCMKVSAVERLYNANAEADPRVCGLMALGFFSVLRTSSIERLRAEDVRVDERLIILPASQFKTKRRHVIDGDMVPGNVWGWIERLEKKDYGIKKNTFTLARNRALKRAGLELSALPNNGMRHSFASYYCALEGSAGKAALAIGHVGESLLWRHYKGVMSKADAVLYFGVRN